MLSGRETSWQGAICSRPLCNLECLPDPNLIISQSASNQTPIQTCTCDQQEAQLEWCTSGLHHCGHPTWLRPDRLLSKRISWCISQMPGNGVWLFQTNISRSGIVFKHHCPAGQNYREKRFIMACVCCPGRESSPERRCSSAFLIRLLPAVTYTTENIDGL